MAITRRLQARTTVTVAVHSALVTGKAALLAKQIEILSETANANGTVTIVFCGQGLGKTAVPTPPPCAVTVTNGEIHVLPIE